MSLIDSRLCYPLLLLDSAAILNKKLMDGNREKVTFLSLYSDF